MARKVTLAEDSAFRHHGAYRHRNHLRSDLVHGIVVPPPCESRKK